MRLHTGLWGVFLNCFDHECAWVRYLADSSYWCYLASLTPIMMMQLVGADWQMAAFIKVALNTAVTMLALLASYQWCVRYTIIGAILNGRKQRASSETAMAPDAVLAAKLPSVTLAQ